ncbi:MFS transporter [Streptosporangium vulgare]|uniref:MFS transporter n=1 Tax=Streptosporangium vulgare TaxID=46190 RepID=UPI0031E0B34F
MNTSERTRLPGTVLLLCLSQIVGSLGLAAGATAGPLLAELITGSAAYGPTAMGALVTGSALAGPAAGTIMRRLGRVWGPAACNLCATAGAAVVVFSVNWGLASLLLGTVLLGAGTTGVMLGRYLATDLVDERRAPQAMGLAVAAVTVGAVLGPVLLGPTGVVAEAAGLPPQTGLHLLAVVVFPLASLILLRLRGGGGPEAPATGTPASGRGTGRLLPLLVLGTGNLSMVAIMGSVPNHLQHSGWDLQAVGMFAALHIGAMFAFAPVSAALCRRFGPPHRGAGRGAVHDRLARLRRARRRRRLRPGAAGAGRGVLEPAPGQRQHVAGGGDAGTAAQPRRRARRARHGRRRGGRKPRPGRAAALPGRASAALPGDGRGQRRDRRGARRQGAVAPHPGGPGSGLRGLRGLPEP